MVEWKPLPIIWDVPDDLWERIGPVILELDPPQSKGRKRVDQRKMLEGIIFRMRSGCQWNHLPRELGDDSTIHRTFQRWVGCGALEAIWAVLIEECQELGGVNWEWQSADCSIGKARFGGRHWTQPHRPGQSREQEGWGLVCIMAVRQPIVGRDTFRVGQPDQPEVPVPLWQSADGGDTLGVGGPIRPGRSVPGGQLVLGLHPVGIAGCRKQRPGPPGA